MSNFGQTLFGGSRFVRLALSPFVVLFAVVMPFIIVKWTPLAVAIMVVMELLCVALLFGFWMPPRLGRWAFRILTGMIFLGYFGYVIYEFFFTMIPFRVALHRGEASPFNALLGFVIIGLPCLWYSLLGRFTPRTPKYNVGIDELDNGINEDTT
jgi:hypothetical protein